jgi:tetratricopeptide (TPR) repeat protein
LEKGCFIGPQPVWRRSVHDDYGYFDASYRISADYEFWLRISQTYDFQHIPQTLGLYLEREDSIEHSDRPQKKHEDHKIITAYTDAAASGRIIGPSDDPSHAVGADIVHSNHQQQTIHPPIRVQDTKGGENQGDPLMSTQETILIAIEDMIAKGQKEAACWAMDKMLADYPDHPELHSRRAAMAYEQGDMDQALQHFETAAALAPRNAFIQRQVGDFFYVVQKDGPKALAQYEKALTVAPDDVEILMLAGHVSLTLHQYPQARDYYHHVRRIDPSNSDVQQFLDKLSQQPTTAQANPVSIDELYTSAQEKVREQQGQVAIGLLGQLLEREPEHALSHNDLGVLYYEAGDMERAQTHYESACQLVPENETFQKNLADFYWNALEDPQMAMQQYVQVLKLNPQDVGTLLSCAQICLAVHQKADASDFLNAVLTLEPWNGDARQMQLQLEGQAESPDTALDTTADITEDSTVDTADATDNWYHQAKDKAAAGDLETAIDLLNRVIARSPDQAHCHNELGVLYYETGDKEKALANYEHAVRLAPAEPNYVKNLADFYLIEQERAEDAMKLYLGVLEQNPDDVEALMATALVCASISNVADAQHFYDRVLAIEPWNQSAMDAVALLQKQAKENGKQEGHTAAAG